MSAVYARKKRNKKPIQLAFIFFFFFRMCEIEWFDITGDKNIDDRQ